MKTIGILDGMSAASTQIYYRELCALTRARIGGLHSPELLIRSVDFAKIEALQMKGNWKAAGSVLNHEAKAPERGGAEVIILATNTMHMVATQNDGWCGYPVHSHSGSDCASNQGSKS